MSYRICITGSIGFLGSIISEYLIIRGHSVLGIDNSLYKNGHIAEKLSKMYGKNRYQHFNLDVTQDFQGVGNIIKTCDVLIPLACLVGQACCSKYPELAQKTNVDAIAHQISCCENQKIIFANTNSGATNGPNGISDETCPTIARSEYSIQKNQAADIVAKYPNHIILKLATVFGPSWRTRLDLLVNTICYEAFFNKKVELYEGAFKRNYLGTPDIARLFSHCIDNFESMKGETYNAGADHLNCTKKELCEKISKHIPFETYQSNLVDPDCRDYVISSAKLTKTGFKPNYSLDEGIEDLVDWFKTLPTDRIERESWIKYNRNTSI